MVPIYICEDDIGQREKLKKYVAGHIMIEDYDMELVLATENPVEIIQRVEEKPSKSIYFFDIDLGHEEYNGLQLASKVREYDPDGYIVFITTHAELTHLTFQFKVNALDFVIKDGTDSIQKRIGECLAVVQERMSLKNESREVAYFSYTSLDKTYYLPLADILFFETGDSHKVIVYTEKKRVEFTGSLNQVEKEIGKGFFRSHRGTIVNLSKITGVDSKNGQIMLDNGQSCDLSVRKAGKLKKEMKE